jgi:hypothetical protein
VEVREALLQLEEEQQRVRREAAEQPVNCTWTIQAAGHIMSAICHYSRGTVEGTILEILASLLLLHCLIAFLSSCSIERLF